MQDRTDFSFAPALCLVVEDQAAMAEALKQTVLAAFPKTEVVLKPNLQESQAWLSQKSKSTPLDLALVDLGLPDGSGVHLIRQIAEKEPQARSVVVTIYDDDAYLFEALSAGAHGYLLKEEEPALLVETLKRLKRDEPPLSPAIARRLLSHFQAPSEKPEPVASDLSPRERETLTLIAKGLTVAEAAKQMGLSAQTVAGYVKIVYQKLHVSNRVEATRVAIRRGLV